MRIPRTNQHIRYFRRASGVPKTIHMASDFPEPKGKGFVQCGRYATIQLEELSRAEVRKARDYEFCKRCTQLIGLK